MVMFKVTQRSSYLWRERIVSVPERGVRTPLMVVVRRKFAVLERSELALRMVVASHPLSSFGFFIFPNVSRSG